MRPAPSMPRSRSAGTRSGAGPSSRADSPPGARPRTPPRAPGEAALARSQLRPKAPPPAGGPARPLPAAQRESATTGGAKAAHPGKSFIGADVWAMDRSQNPICRKFNSGSCASPCVHLRSHACSSCGRQGHNTLSCEGPTPAPAWARPQFVARHAFEASELPIQKELTHEAA